MDMVNVIVIKNGVVFENKLFTGKSAVAKAEEMYLEFVKEINPELGIGIIEDTLIDGYYEGPECCVCISWPEVIKAN